MNEIEYDKIQNSSKWNFCSIKQEDNIRFKKTIVNCYCFAIVCVNPVVYVVKSLFPDDAPL